MANSLALPSDRGQPPPGAGQVRSGGSAGTSTRPRQVAGAYPMRKVTYYQISTSDIRSIGVAQVATTLFASVGAFALSLYLDYNKDIALAELGEAGVPSFLRELSNVAFWAWLFFWILATFAFFWRQSEWSRIKIEHGESSILSRIKKKVSPNDGS
jgi:hypothetical protein